MKKAILFCNLPYSFSILQPIRDELIKRGFEYLWYVPSELISSFTLADDYITSDIKNLEMFDSDMIFVPGNDLPWYLKGVKIQIFHGLAGEKKGHFRIRDYFDLYLTQGPYFTKRFEKLAEKHNNFSVIETGWCKLDKLYIPDDNIKRKKMKMLQKSKARKIIVYAPTFSPSLTSAQKLLEQIVNISKKDEYLVIVKFHDKMNKDICKYYEKKSNRKFIILKDDDIIVALKIADLLVSDTSSVVYEFLLLNKPVVTLQSRSENIVWEDIKTPQELEKTIYNTLFINDRYRTKRDDIIKQYHPYIDGKSAYRMVEAALSYIDKFGVPKKREISFIRKLKMIKKYGLFRW